jgi:hypothetical protein
MSAPVPRLTLLLLCLTGLAGGCRRDRTPPPAGYFGPTEPVLSVVQRVNANAGRVPTLWGRGYFEGDVRFDDGSTQFVNGDFVLLYRRPGEYRLVCRKDIAGQVMEVGSTDERYWLIVRPTYDTMWWGEYASLAQADPTLLPVRPDLLVELLGLSAFDSDLMSPPAPVMRFNNDADAYTFIWVIPARSRLIAMKEIWFDRKTLRPTVVVLFDDEGRAIARAYLSDHKPLPVEGLAPADWPTVPGTFRLFFPDTGSRVMLRLDEAKLTNNGVPREAD